MGIDLKNWMQNLPDGSDLLALNLCGTFDCPISFAAKT